MITTGRPITILAVDDHPLFREGIAALISNQPDMKLVAEASNGRDAIEKVRTVRPAVVLLDLQMPEMGGLDALTAIRREAPSCKVIVLTTYGGDVLAQRALQAGAQAYLLKGHVRKELLDTIRAVYAGGKRVDPDVAAEIAVHLGETNLSDREIEVLRLVADGKSNKAIAAQLSITEETAKGHLKSIFAKLGTNDRTHAVTLALQRGMLDLGSRHGG
jgi:DNA-binding NarL/FixJ family response regulator